MSTASRIRAKRSAITYERRLQLLIRAGEVFHRSLDLDETLHNVAQLAVESFADICIFDLRDDRSDRLYVSVVAHSDPRLEPIVKRALALRYETVYRPHPVVRVSQTGEPEYIPNIGDDAIMWHAASAEHAALMRDFGYRSKIVVPVVADATIFGALTFVRTHEGAEFTPADVTLAVELGRRAGVAVSNARRYRREQYVAETLQGAFVPTVLPRTERLRCYGIYRPAGTSARIGGDWYDAFRTPQGTYVVAIGDVAGHGMRAARTMVQLRTVVRSAGIASDDVRQIVTTANQTLLFEQADTIATMFVGVIDADAKGLSYASAGHLPPLMRHADGSIESLMLPSPPLGVSHGTSFEVHHLRLRATGLLALYTDGITEIDRNPAEGELRLREALASDAAAYAADPARYLTRVAAGTPAHDDVAIMVVALGSAQPAWEVETHSECAVRAVRDELLAAVQAVHEPSEAALADCRLVFMELLANAVRFAPGPLSVVLESTAYATLHLIDDGPGFDYHPRLPEDLWSESGRGLYLVSRLCGHVDVERLPGRGVHIAARLPV